MCDPGVQGAQATVSRHSLSPILTIHTPLPDRAQRFASDKLLVSLVKEDDYERTDFSPHRDVRDKLS